MRADMWLWMWPAGGGRVSTAARGRRRVTTQFLAEVEEILREVLVSKGDFDRVLVRQPVLAAKEERGLVDVQTEIVLASRDLDARAAAVHLRDERRVRLRRLSNLVPKLRLWVRHG